MTIADRILELRKTKGISQEELADKINVSRQAISKWESGQSFPDLDKIVILSEYFNVTTDYLIKGISENNENVVTSKILYIASTFFIIIGLLSAIGGWYDKQTADSVVGGMLIQAVGITGYFIGRTLSSQKSSLIIKLLNIAVTLFMPLSLGISFISNSFPAPYPTDVIYFTVFIIAYVILLLITYVTLKSKTK